MKHNSQIIKTKELVEKISMKDAFKRKLKLIGMENITAGIYILNQAGRKILSGQNKKRKVEAVAESGGSNGAADGDKEKPKAKKPRSVTAFGLYVKEAKKSIEAAILAENPSLSSEELKQTLKVTYTSFDFMKSLCMAFFSRPLYLSSYLFD